MQPNQQSFNIIYIVSHPLYPGTGTEHNGPFFRHANFIILKAVKEIEITNQHLR